MEKTHEITEKQLLFLNSFLKKYNISYQENVELKDHIISEFEYCGNDNLSQYLSDKLSFIRTYAERNKSSLLKKYKKQVWKQFVWFFTDLKTLPITVSVIAIMLFASIVTTPKLRLLLFFTTIITLNIYGFSLLFHKNKKIRKNTEFKRIYHVFGISSIFLYMFISPIHTFLINNYLAFFSYWFIAVSISVSEIVVAKQKRVKVLDKLNYLLNNYETN